MNRVRPAPRLDRRMVLEERVETANGSGGFSLAWVELGAHWVSVLPGAGRGDAVGHLPRGVVPLRLILRASAPGAASRPRPGQRLREGVRVYPVIAVVEQDPDARYLCCHAHEEVPA